VSADTPDPTHTVVVLDAHGLNVSADTSSAAGALPAAGDELDGRTVRASGTLPVLGLDFVVLRHTARLQVRAVASARAQLRNEGTGYQPAGRTAPEAFDPAVLAAYAAANLIADAARFRRPGSDAWEAMKSDDVLDLDADDFDALNNSAGEGQAAPVPPSPSS